MKEWAKNVSPVPFCRWLVFLSNLILSPKAPCSYSVQCFLEDATSTNAMARFETYPLWSHSFASIFSELNELAAEFADEIKKSCIVKVGNSAGAILWARYKQNGGVHTYPLQAVSRTRAARTHTTALFSSAPPLRCACCPAPPPAVLHHTHTHSLTNTALYFRRMFVTSPRGMSALCLCCVVGLSLFPKRGR